MLSKGENVFLAVLLTSMAGVAWANFDSIPCHVFMPPGLAGYCEYADYRVTKWFVVPAVFVVLFITSVKTIAQWFLEIENKPNQFGSLPNGAPQKSLFPFIFLKNEDMVFQPLLSRKYFLVRRPIQKTALLASYFLPVLVLARFLIGKGLFARYIELGALGAFLNIVFVVCVVVFLMGVYFGTLANIFGVILCRSIGLDWQQPIEDGDE